VTNCLILKIKTLEFLGAPVVHPGTVSAFGEGYLAMSREINAQKNRKMHERLIKAFLR